MDIFDKIEKFQYRYIILNKNQYDNIRSKYKDRIKNQEFPYNCAYCILDWEKKEIMIFSPNVMRPKTFNLYNGNKKGIGKYNLSFLDIYETDDKSLLLQSDKVSPNIMSMDHVYAIDNIWLAYIYRTKSNKKRMCINNNIFGTYKLIGSRNMILNEILLNL